MISDRQYFVYILASRKHGTLYIGITNDLLRRIWEHREGIADGFTKEYGIRHLVYFESYVEVSEAITREKRLKKWRRDWKIALIEEHSPEWVDLYHGLMQ